MNDILFSLNFIVLHFIVLHWAVIVFIIIVLHWAVIFDMLNMTAAMIKITKTI